MAFATPAAMTTIARLGLALCAVATAVAGVLLWQELSSPRDAGGPATTEEGRNNERLRRAVRDRLAAESRYDAAEIRQRATAKKERIAAIEALKAELDRYEQEQGQSLLDDAVALSAAFDGTLVPITPRTSTGLSVLTDDPITARVIFTPENYRPEHAKPTVLLAGAGSDPEQVRRHVETTWLSAAREHEMLLVAPITPAGIDFQRRADDGPDAEGARIRALLAPWGQAMRERHIDRRRLVLDCGRGTSTFGLRLVSMFGDRFAGVVIRWPTPDDDLRIEALTGMPILLLRNPETAAACDQLHARLEARATGSCTVMASATADVAKWVLAQRRDMMSPRVVVAPIHDRFHRNRWIQVAKCDPVGEAPWHDAPLLVAEADREHNVITVTTRGVQSFHLLLGPALVDSRDFTLIVNGGQPQRVQLPPSLAFLVNNVLMRNDDTYLFTAKRAITVQ